MDWSLLIKQLWCQFIKTCILSKLNTVCVMSFQILGSVVMFQGIKYTYVAAML